MTLRNFIAEFQTAVRRCRNQATPLPTLTPRVKLVIQKALAMASERNTQCDPGFLVLALLEVESDTRGVLQHARISAQEIVERLRGQPLAAQCRRQALPADTMQILTELAPREAQLLRDRYVGTEALLLGMLKQNGATATWLARRGLDYVVALRAIKRIRNRAPRMRIVWPTFAHDPKALQ